MGRTRIAASRTFWLVAVLTVALGHVPAIAADTGAVTLGMEPVVPQEFSGDVRDLPLIYAPPTPYRPRPGGPPPVGLTSGSSTQSNVLPSAGPSAAMPSPTQNFAGLNFLDLCGGSACGGGWPAVSNGAAGRNHYVQAVNFAYAIYSKTGTLLASFTENQLFSAAGTTPCNGNNFGDAVVLYDQLANRFILTNLAFAKDGGGFPTSPFYQCIAVSKTSDPVSGGWFVYPVRMDPGGVGYPPVGALNDYGKFGLWTDCLYMGTNEYQMPGGSFSGTFIGNLFAAFSRTDLYSGAPLTWSLAFVGGSDQRFLPIPANMSGTRADTAPPTGRPNYFVSQGPTSFQVRAFTAGPNCGGGGTLSAPTNVSQAGYTVPAGNVVPQPGTSTLLDALDDRMMQKVQYRRTSTTESLWVVHNVQTTVGADTTVKPQWAQIDVTGGVLATTPVQQQIYAPDTMLNRWMGSLAVDNQGNTAVGYSTSNGVVPNYPSIAYAGRLAGDPLNTLPQSEIQLVAGASSQTNSCGGQPCHRWGDYSGMSIDPADDCTFWYTNQYYSSSANGASGNWQTRIGAFTFPSCTPVIPIPAERDFNGNLTTDILWRNTTSGDLAMWLMIGPTIATGAFVTTVPTTWSVVGLGDFNGDGKADVLWRDTSGNLAMWLMNGTTVASGNGLGNVATSWTPVGIGDFNGDGKADILWRDTAGNLAMWLMNGFSMLSNTFMTNVSTAWTIVAIGDFNGDGKADILWRDTSGNVAMWLMNGPTVTSGGFITNVPTMWSVVGPGDFDGDGKADILWRDTSGNLALWFMNGTTIAGGNQLGNVATAWVPVRLGDFDGDGKADILWRDTSGDLAMWLMNGATVVSNTFITTVSTTWAVQ